MQLIVVILRISTINRGKKMTTFQKAILKRLDIFLKLFSNYLVIKTIESDVVKTLTDKQIETVVPIATDKLKTMNKNIYDN
jgi:hypothetical protein